MRHNSHSKQKRRKNQSFNMYAWGKKNRKVFATIICFMLVLGLLVSLIQVQ